MTDLRENIVEHLVGIMAATGRAEPTSQAGFLDFLEVGLLGSPTSDEQAEARRRYRQMSPDQRHAAAELHEAAQRERQSGGRGPEGAL